MTTQTQALELNYRQDPEVQKSATLVQNIADIARELEIRDEKSNAYALELLAQAATARKRIEALRKRWIDPLNKQIKLIRADFDELARPASEAESTLRAKTAAWRAKVAEAARKEQERLRKLAEQRQAKAAAKAAERGIEPPPVVPIVPTVAAPPKTVATEAGAKVTYRRTIHYEITDPDAVPREWCCPDEKKIGAAVRAGLIADGQVPGIRVWVTEEAVVRA